MANGLDMTLESDNLNNIKIIVSEPYDESSKENEIIEDEIIEDERGKGGYSGEHGEEADEHDMGIVSDQNRKEKFPMSNPSTLADQDDELAGPIDMSVLTSSLPISTPTGGFGPYSLFRAIARQILCAQPVAKSSDGIGMTSSTLRSEDSDNSSDESGGPSSLTALRSSKGLQSMGGISLRKSSNRKSPEYYLQPEEELASRIYDDVVASFECDAVWPHVSYCDALYSATTDILSCRLVVKLFGKMEVKEYGGGALLFAVEELPQCGYALRTAAPLPACNYFSLLDEANNSAELTMRKLDIAVKLSSRCRVSAVRLAGEGNSQSKQQASSSSLVLRLYVALGAE